MDWTYTLPLVASPFCFPPDRLPTQQPADIEDVPGAFLLRGVLTEDECAAIVAGTEAIGYVEGEGEGGGLRLIRAVVLSDSVVGSTAHTVDRRSG